CLEKFSYIRGAERGHRKRVASVEIRVSEGDNGSVGRQRECLSALGVGRTDVGYSSCHCPADHGPCARILVDGYVILVLGAWLQFRRNLGRAIWVCLLRIKRTVRLNQ